MMTIFSLITNHVSRESIDEFRDRFGILPKKGVLWGRGLVALD